jgi:hypothetical protein
MWQRREPLALVVVELLHGIGKALMSIDARLEHSEQLLGDEDERGTDTDT